MKAIYKVFGTAFAGILMVGCADLDTVPESNTITADQKGEVASLDPSKVEASVNAVFSQMKQYMPNADALGQTRHNDFGYGSIMLMMDNNGFDMVSDDNGYNWYGNEIDFSDRDYTSRETKIIWGTLYQQIYAANAVIGTIDAETQDPVSQFYLAQGLADRAFNYWVLAQLFQFNYVGHTSSPCVPLITEENAGSVGVDGCPRSTVEEVYNLIMKDINKAVELMESTTMKPADKRYVSKAVAYGLRARINLTMQKWSEAASDAQKAIDAFTADKGAPYSISDVSKPSFWDSADKSWMWAIVVAETDRVVSSGIVNFPSHIGSLGYGYASYMGGRQINKTLFNTIPQSDVRKGWWIDENLTSPNLNDAQTKDMADKSYPAYTNVKYAPYNDQLNNKTNAADIPLMRVEEMYLIKAEGQAMSGDVTGAKTTLESLIVTYRDPSYSCSATSASEMQEEIYRQRRIELWGEGLSWFDIMRLGKDVDRRGAGYPNPTSVLNIPAGSDILIYRLPENEIQGNQQISESDNNPAATQPMPVPDID